MKMENKKKQRLNVLSLAFALLILFSFVSFGSAEELTYSSMKIQPMQDGLAFLDAGNNPLISFHGIDEGFMSPQFSKIKLIVDSYEDQFAFSILNGIALDPTSSTKFYLERKNQDSNSVCVSDISGLTDAGDIEANCILVACPSAEGTYTCGMKDNWFIVSGPNLYGSLEKVSPISGDALPIIYAETYTEPESVERNESIEVNNIDLLYYSELQESPQQDFPDFDVTSVDSDQITEGKFSFFDKSNMNKILFIILGILALILIIYLLIKYKPWRRNSNSGELSAADNKKEDKIKELLDEGYTLLKKGKVEKAEDNYKIMQKLYKSMNDKEESKVYDKIVKFYKEILKKTT